MATVQAEPLYPKECAAERSDIGNRPEMGQTKSGSTGNPSGKNSQGNSRTSSIREWFHTEAPGTPGQVV